MPDKEASSAVAEGHADAPGDKKDRRASSSSGTTTIKDLVAEGKDFKIAKESEKLNWKINTSPTADSLGVSKDLLAKPFITPLVKKADLFIPPGVELTARNLKGVTVKDVLDAIHKQFKKRSDDELDLPVLSHFYHDKEDNELKEKIQVVLVKEGQSGKKKK